jgi:NAD-dependent deacetylase
MSKKVVVLSGAGISAESGIQTFRDSDGLWEGYDVQEVATPEAWEHDSALVQKFYNERRKAVRAAEPNAAHLGLVELEGRYDVHIITQNIDDLHERAGSKKVLHLHGEITKSRSSIDESLIYDVTGDTIEMGELCEKGSQIRPHIVWFGEAVPMMDEAARIASTADVFLVIGTSLVVYPAASLVDYVPRDSPIYVIDPGEPAMSLSMRARGESLKFIQEKACSGVLKLLEIL